MCGVYVPWRWQCLEPNNTENVQVTDGLDF